MTAAAEPRTPGSTVELDITGMTCASCANRIERKLNKVTGVLATVNYATEKAKVSYGDDVGTDVLLALTDPSLTWPTPYLLKTPRFLGRGTEVFVVARSTSGQPRNLRVRLSRYP